MRTSNKGGDYENAPPGMHPGRCYKIVDLGTHANPRRPQDNPQHKIMVHFELPLAKMKDGTKCFSVSKRYTLSHNEKAILRKDLETWYGRTFDTRALDEAGGFEVKKLLGRPALLNILHNESGGKVYANIVSINPIPEGMTVPEAVNPNFYYSIEEHGTKGPFLELSEKMRAFIMEAEEFQEKPAHRDDAPPPKPEFDDDIPF